MLPASKQKQEKVNCCTVLACTFLFFPSCMLFSLSWPYPLQPQGWLHTPQPCHVHSLLCILQPWLPTRHSHGWLPMLTAIFWCVDSCLFPDLTDENITDRPTDGTGAPRSVGTGATTKKNAQDTKNHRRLFHPLLYHCRRRSYPMTVLLIF